MTADHSIDHLPDRLVLTVAEVAGLLGVSRWLVQQAAHSGELPCIRLGRRILFPRARIEEIVNGEPPADVDADIPTFNPSTDDPRSAQTYPQPATRDAQMRAFRTR